MYQTLLIYIHFVTCFLFVRGTQVAGHSSCFHFRSAKCACFKLVSDFDTCGLVPGPNFITPFTSTMFRAIGQWTFQNHTLLEVHNIQLSRYGNLSEWWPGWQGCLFKLPQDRGGTHGHADMFGIRVMERTPLQATEARMHCHPMAMTPRKEGCSASLTAGRLEKCDESI